MIKLILMNGGETEITFPCREKELYDCLEKIGIPELVPPIVYLKEIISPKEYAGLAGKVQNLDEINYFAGYEENLIPADRVKLQAVVSREKELTPSRLINLCFDLDRYELKQKERSQNGVRHCLGNHFHRLDADHRAPRSFFGRCRTRHRYRADLRLD